MLNLTRCIAPRRLEIVRFGLRSVEFIDLTDRLAALVGDAERRAGLLHLRLHTTTGLLINEAEPLLLEDLAGAAGAMARAAGRLRHDDFSRRTINVAGPRERATAMRTAARRCSVHRDGHGRRTGGLCLGRWQRVLFAEFDGPQCRDYGSGCCRRDQRCDRRLPARALR